MCFLFTTAQSNTTTPRTAAKPPYKENVEREGFKVAYIGGWYYVRSWTKKGRIFDKDFPTEQEARAFGNEQWKLPYVVKVMICKMGFTSKKRRKTVVVAEAHK